MPLLRVRNLVVGAGGDPRNRPLVKDVSLDLDAGGTLGLVGESGSGKSTLARAVCGLLPPELSVWSGEVELDSTDITRVAPQQLRRIQGARLAYVAQEPALALNPILTVGFQIEEVLRAHLPLTRGERRARTLELLVEVGLLDVERVHAARPHELSGGERQRVALAQALSCRPALLIADEPTTALDPATRVELLDLLGRLRARHGLSLLMISHDIEMVAARAERVVVMYAGEIAEEASSAELEREPRHPYSRALARCLQKETRSGRERFVTIPGMPPQLPFTGPGCSFEPRCDQRLSRCRDEHPAEFRIGAASRVRCWLHES